MSLSKFKYDVFLTLRDPDSCVKAYVENKLRDAGVRAFVDEEEVFSAHEAVSGSRIVMVLFTPEFLQSEKCLKRLVARTMWWNNNVMPVFCGVSRREVHNKMVALSPRFELTGVASQPGFKLSVDSGLPDEEGLSIKQPLFRLRLRLRGKRNCRPPLSVWKSDCM